MEPIQDDIETVRENIGYIGMTADVMAALAALERLVAERDNLQRLWEKASTSNAGLEAERDRWKQKWVEDTSALEEERDALENFRKVAEAIFDGGFIGSDRARLDLMYGVWLNWKAV